MNTYIVCSDPRHTNPIGTLATERQRQGLEARGVALLPVDPAKLHQGPNTGFAYVPLGEGYHYAGNRPVRAAQTLLNVKPGLLELHWWARLQRIDPERPMGGQLKLITETSTQLLAVGLQTTKRVESIDNNALALDVYGCASANLNISGLLALALHGICENVNVMAFAVALK